MKKLLDSIIDNNKRWTVEGRVATYIPALAKASANELGICVYEVNGQEYCSGDYSKKFTIQSISKVITLMLAMLDNGIEDVFSKVGMEPTADAFNSVLTLEAKNSQKPINPMINAGAIATVSMVKGESRQDAFSRILDFARKITGNPDLNINEEVYLSEKETGNRNRSLAYFMKSTGAIKGNVEDVLDAYFKQCSIEANCIDIARIGAMLANDGLLPWNGEQVVPKNVAKIVKTIMATCGMYDESGLFAVHIGIPAKSGVGGGILASVPGKMGIGTYGPALDIKGNSIAGIKMLEELSKELDLSIF